MINRALKLFLLEHMIVPNYAQFSCIVGWSCVLPIFDYGLPNTPKIRVSDAACGASSSNSAFERISMPVAFLDLGVIPSIVGRVNKLNVCYTSPSVLDPSFPLQFGTVDLVGPTVAGGAWVCYFGSPCAVAVTGNKLSSVPSSVFFSDSGSCSMGPSPRQKFDLVNNKELLESEGPIFQYESFGTVDPFLRTMTSLEMCWWAYPGESTPDRIGTLTLTGPLTRDRKIVCYMGESCDFVFTDGAMNVDFTSSVFAISSSGSCDRLLSLSPVTWPSSFSAIATLKSSPALFSFGEALGLNGQLVSEQNALCWKSSSSVEHFLVKVGTMSMIGPTSEESFYCIAGVACEITLTGNFDSFILSQNYPLRVLSPSSVCGAVPLYTGTLVIDSSSTSNQEAITYSFADSIGILESGSKLCWGPNNVYVGTLSTYGPTAQFGAGNSLACVVSQPCSIELPMNFAASPPSRNWVQKLTLLSDANPISTAFGNYNSISRTTFFEFKTPIPFASTDFTVQVVTWELVVVTSDGPTRPVELGSWTAVGPRGGLSVACIFGQSCQVSIPNTESDDVSVFLIPTTSASGSCKDWNIRSPLPVFRGDNVANPAVKNGNIFSFGTIFGSISGTESSFALCYCPRPSLKYSANLGSVSFSKSVSLNSGIFSCEIGTSSCNIDVLTTSSQGLNNALYISSASNCADQLTLPIGPVQSASSFTQQFSLTNIPGSFVGTTAGVCYLFSGTQHGIFLGYIEISGIVLQNTGASNCILGSADFCSVSLKSVPPNPTALITATSSVSNSCSDLPPYSNNNNPIAWSLNSDFTSLTASAPIAQVQPGSSNLLTFCYSSNSAVAPVPVGTLRLQGPYASLNTPTCLVGSDCAFTLSGSFVPGVGEIILRSIACNDNTDPITDSSYMSDTLTGAHFDLGILEISAEIDNVLICWRFDTDSLYVFAGTLNLVGARASQSLKCTVSSTNTCDLDVSLSGLSASLVGSRAALVDGNTCDSSAMAAAQIKIAGNRLVKASPGSTLTEQTFSFGPISGFDPNRIVSLCWSPNNDERYFPSVLIGPVALSRAPCDRTYFAQQLLSESQILDAISSSNPDFVCEMTYIVSSTNQLKTYSLLVFTILELNRLAAPAFLNALLSSASNNRLWMAEKDVYGKSVLQNALSANLPSDWINKIISYDPYFSVFSVTDLISVISAKREDVCLTLIDRFPAQSALQPAASNGLAKCLAAILGRQRIDSSIKSAALVASFDHSQIDCFRILLDFCCPSSLCVSSTFRAQVMQSSTDFSTVLRDSEKRQVCPPS